VDTLTPAAELDRLGAELVRRAGQVVMDFGAGQPEHRICVRPLPVDGYPVVGRLPALANAYLAVTHSGMTLAPLLARLIADEIINDACRPELSSYRPARF
jgi:glycine/D-amino acid oxidase-like deaminating enzyme